MAKMTNVLLRILCNNRTIAYLLTNMSSPTGSPQQGAQDESAQKDALLYIIVVLTFYSLGVVIMMIKYLKRERRELEEERMLEDFLKHRPNESVVVPAITIQQQAPDDP